MIQSSTTPDTRIPQTSLRVRRCGLGQLYTIRKQCNRKIQIETVGIATGATKQVSLDMVHWETGWESLEKIRHKHKLCLFFQINSGVSPNYLSSLIPASVEDSTTYNFITQIILNTHCPEPSYIIDHFCRLV